MTTHDRDRSDRDRILRRIRRAQVPTAEPPSLDEPWITFEDRVDQFIRASQSVGGAAHGIQSDAEGAAIIRALPEFSAASVIYSQIPELVESTIRIEEFADPHDLAQVEYGVFPGEFGVAENGAIWLTNERLIHRVLYFIVQHLVIVISTDQIVDNMHQAYERLCFTNRSFGVFMSGPSKTADIEQSLVIGAHGARSLTVLLRDQGT